MGIPEKKNLVYRSCGLCCVLLSCTSLVLLRRLHEWTRGDIIMMFVWIVGPLVLGGLLLFLARRNAVRRISAESPKQRAVRRKLDAVIGLLACIPLSMDIVTLLSYYEATRFKNDVDQISEQALAVRDVAMVRIGALSIFLVVVVLSTLSYRQKEKNG